jgi:L-2,4-diaminobutyrate transaminase
MQNTGTYFKNIMRSALAGHPHVSEIRGEGLLLGIEYVDDKASRKRYQPMGKVGPQAAAALLKRKVIGRAMPQGDIIGFAPPLCLNRDEAGIIAAAAKEAVEEVLGS